MEELIVLSEHYKHSSDIGLDYINFEIGFGGNDSIPIQLNKDFQETYDTIKINRPASACSEKLSVTIYTKSKTANYEVKIFGTLDILPNGNTLNSVSFTFGIQKKNLFVFLRAEQRFSIEYKPTKKNHLLELQNMIGLNAAKQQVAKHLAYIKTQRKRKEMGLPEVNVSKHLIFLGNPGTGKTTVARLIGNIYYEEGICTNHNVIEVDRSDLVGGYIGQTALKTTEMLNRALGGVLFIDEAYSLMPHEDSSLDYGKEAIDTIIKFMEDHRDEIVVIAAGYEDDMQRFLESNPGLKSRFKTIINFDDYNVEELVSIFNKLCIENGYDLEPSAAQMVHHYFQRISENRIKGFANGREVRNFFENCLQKQAMRVAEIENPTRQQLSLILNSDIFTPVHSQ